jgi:acyl-CoA thioesterase I
MRNLNSSGSIAFITKLIQPYHCLISIAILCLSTSLVTAEPSKSILVFGDSISASYGMNPKDGWVQLFSDRMEQEFTQFKVVNASISGETTGGGLVRISQALATYRPDLVIVELGGNDGLRGYPASRIKDNLNQIIRQCQEAGADVLLIGMILPANYGYRYTQAFQDLYKEVAETNPAVYFIPFLLQGPTTPRTLLQQDGIHPTAEAQPMILGNIWPLLLNWLNTN